MSGAQGDQSRRCTESRAVSTAKSPGEGPIRPEEGGGERHFRGALASPRSAGVSWGEKGAWRASDGVDCRPQREENWWF